MFIVPGILSICLLFLGGEFTFHPVVSKMQNLFFLTRCCKQPGDRVTALLGTAVLTQPDSFLTPLDSCTLKHTPPKLHTHNVKANPAGFNWFTGLCCNSPSLGGLFSLLPCLPFPLCVLISVLSPGIIWFPVTEKLRFSGSSPGFYLGVTIAATFLLFIISVLALLNPRVACSSVSKSRPGSISWCVWSAFFFFFFKAVHMIDSDILEWERVQMGHKFLYLGLAFFWGPQAELVVIA